MVYEVQVLSPGLAASIATLGDSITEGACSSVDANGDWPDLLAARMPALADGTSVAVFNAGIGSGRFAASDGAGLRGLTRLDELLTLPNVRWITILMGVNDISYEEVDAAFLEEAYTQAIAKAHAAGKKIIGIPILPFGHSVKDVGENTAGRARASTPGSARTTSGPGPPSRAMTRSSISSPSWWTRAIPPGPCCQA